MNMSMNSPRTDSRGKKVVPRRRLNRRDANAPGVAVRKKNISPASKMKPFPSEKKVQMEKALTPVLAEIDAMMVSMNAMTARLRALRSKVKGMM